MYQGIFRFLQVEYKEMQGCTSHILLPPQKRLAIQKSIWYHNKIANENGDGKIKFGWIELARLNISVETQLNHSTNKLNSYLESLTISPFSSGLLFPFDWSDLSPIDFCCWYLLPFPFPALLVQGYPFKVCFPFGNSSLLLPQIKPFRKWLRKKVQTFGISILISKGGGPRFF